MSEFSRRSAIQKSAVAAAVVALPSNANAASDSRPLRVGLIGTKRGLSVAKEFRKVGFEISAVCDVDESRLAKATKEFSDAEPHADLRRVLDDPTIDAVIVATPDHWHAPAAILALDAGKHVYVEKPCAHNIREGRLLIEAAKRSGKVVQVGTQTRSTPILQNAIELLRSGAIGDVKMAKAWNSQRRGNIGHEEPSDVPKGFDYDLWVGPAPKPAFQKNRHHYTWHWWYDFGTGDAGNDGVHELDIAVWGLDVDTHPSIATGHGTKLYFDDDQQFPDTQHVTFEYPHSSDDPTKKKLIVFENRIWTPYREQDIENGVIFYGTDGYLVFAKIGGYKLYGPKNKLRAEEKCAFSTFDHAVNFASAIKNGDVVNAPPEAGHLGASLAHLANIIGRTGRSSLQFDPSAEQIVGDEEANQFVRRTYRDGHWATPS